VAQRYGPWISQGTLDEGGQGIALKVYRAGDVSKQLFVLKRLKNAKRWLRFEREVAACLRLDHPNILRVVDHDLTAESAYFVAEYCRGGSLRDADLSSYSLLERLHLFAAVCDGVGYAHQNGVVHRDIKPDNIFLKADMATPVVGDFGICFVDEDGERVTLVDEAMGARLFIAPELEDGRLDAIGPASDVYSLGKLLYWLITGEVFSREQLHAPRWDLAKKQPSREHYLLNELLDQLVQHDSVQRLSDASTVAAATRQLQRRIQMEAHAIGPDIPQQCTYCGIGTYATVFDTETLDPTDIHNAGWGILADGVGPPHWRVQVCDHCGNVQWFRPDFAKRRDIWNSPLNR
jgi:serine/threonine protein kinase